MVVVLWPPHPRCPVATSLSSLLALCRCGSGRVWLVIIVVIMVVLAASSSLSLRRSVPDRVSGGSSPW